MLKNGEIVFLDTCKEIILAIPSMMRDPDELDDVLKIKGSKADDCYDACRLGLYGHMAARKQPTEDAVRDYAQELAKHDPMAAHFYLLRKAAEQANRTVTFKPPEQPVWMSKMAQPNQIQ
jgi:hypothetical protein